MEVENKVINIIRECLGLNSSHIITSETKVFEDLGADSLDIVNVISEIEDQFEGKNYISDEKIRDIVTVGDVVQLCREYTGK